jgi:carboxyl-terminal processing protease
MRKKVMALAFVISIFLSFISGYLIQDVLNISFFNRNDDIMNQISDIFEKRYFYDVNDNDLQNIYIQQLFTFVDSFASYYNDPYTRLESYESIFDGNSYGIGISITLENQIPKITHVLYDSDAYMKLYPGDLIVGITLNQSYIDFYAIEDYQVVLEYLKGIKDEVKYFKVKNVLGELRDVEITYTDLTPIDIAYGTIEQQYGYINIKRFNASSDTDLGTAYRFSEALENLENSILSASNPLIIDLRNNPGGSLSALHNKGNSSAPLGIIQQLLPYNPNQSIFEFIDDQGKITKYYGAQDTLKPYPIIVLVNHMSASASEVLAASLSSYGYLVYGEETYGKHVYQNSQFITQINDKEYVLFYTEGSWTYSNGKSITTEPIPIMDLDFINLKQSITLGFDEIVYVDQVNAYVKDIQQFINWIFQTDLRIDGYMDMNTSNALKAIQTQFNLNVTGAYDYPTYQILYNQYLMYVNEMTLDKDLALFLAHVKNN